MTLMAFRFFGHFAIIKLQATDKARICVVLLF